MGRDEYSRLALTELQQSLAPASLCGIMLRTRGQKQQGQRCASDAERTSEEHLQLRGIGLQGNLVEQQVDAEARAADIDDLSCSSRLQ